MNRTSAVVETMPAILENDPEAWALRITARYRMSVEATIATGQLLLEAKEALPHGAFLDMVEEKLPFKARMAQMLMAIASDDRFLNAQYVALLPPSVGTMYELTRVSHDRFVRAAEQGIIRPDMERKEAAALIERPQRQETSGEDGTASRQPEHHSEGSNGVETEGQPKTGDTPELANAPLSEPALSDAPCAEGAGSPAAHMAGRVHPAGDLDFSPTPPWATRALIERVLRHAEREKVCKYQTAWEPACGEGHMAEVLREYFRSVVASDIDPRHGYADAVGDFLSPDLKTPAGTYDWIITNPPFGDNVLPFIKRALDLAGTGVAMFLQLRYLEGVERYEQIYRDRPPTIVAPFVERVPLVMGKYDPEASTTTAFMWLVWLKGADGPALPRAPFWIPPGCRTALTKPDDAARFTQKPVEKKSHAVATLAEPSPPVPARNRDVEIPDIPEKLRRTKA